MFFILSKTINYLTMPIVIVVIFLLLSAVLKNKLWRRRMFWLGLGTFLFCSNEFIANEVMKAWEIAPVPIKSIDNPYKVAIILGGVISGDTELKDRAFFARGADRVYHTAILYKKGLVEHIFVSGGTGRLIDIGQKEAEQIVEVLEVMGVNPEDIMYESNSRNTHENAIETIKALAGRYRPEECLLITSANHMRRARACFEKEGFPMDVFSVDIYTHKRRFTPDQLFIPNVGAMVIWHKLVKEWVGYSAYWVVGYI